MKPPCVFIVGSLLPSLRVMVTKRLIEEHHLKPIEAAKKMDVTPAAITQYLKGIRGKEYVDGVFKREDVQKALSSIVEKLTREKADFPSVLDSICELCKIVRHNGFICEQCMAASPGLKQMDCKLCRY